MDHPKKVAVSASWCVVFFRRRVDPGLRRQNGRLRGSANESFGVSPLSLDEGLASSRGEFFRAPMMNDGWSHETDSRVPVFVVVVAEEVTAEQVSILDGTETLRELRAILQRLELRLGVGIVVRDMRSRVSLGHAEVGQEQGYGLALHRAAARCFRHQMLLRGCGQWYRCGRDRVARPSEQENLDPQPQRNRRRQEDVSKGEPSRGQTGLHSRSSDLTSELQSSVRSDEVVIATEQLQVLIEPLRRASVGKFRR